MEPDGEGSATSDQSREGLPSLSREPAVRSEEVEVVTVLHGNIAGLYTRTNKEKTAMLYEKARENGSVIVALTESHLRSDIKDAEISMPGFQIYRADRTQGIKKGGVVIFLKNEFAKSAQLLSSGSNGVVEWVSLHLQSDNTICICVYRPPTCPVSKFTEVMEQLHQDIEGMGTPAPNIIMCGDFNLPIISWELDEIAGGAGYMREQATRLLEFAMTHSLEQCVRGPTRVDNILDLFLVNNEEMVIETKIHDTIVSDHRLITVVIVLPGRNMHPTTDRPLNDMNSLNFFHSSVDWDVICEKLDSISWRDDFQGETVQYMYEKLCGVLWDVCSELVPYKRCCAVHKIIPRDRRILMRKRSNLNKKVRTCINIQRKSRMIEEIRNIEIALKESLSRERCNAEKKAVNAIKLNPKYFYAYAREKSRFRFPIGPLKVDNELVGDPKKMSDILSRQYKSAFSLPRYSAEEEWQHSVDPENAEHLADVQFSEEDLVRSAARISANSAAGPDGIAAILLKKCIHSLKEPLALMWKQSLQSNEIPHQMKLGTITPIYKGGSRSEAKNYRPVTLTSHIIKLFERVVDEKITIHMNERGLFNPRQHGFRRNRSCLSQLLQHYQGIVEIQEQDNVADVVYLDFSKAFDKVDHIILMRKLSGIGVKGPLLRWIHTFLTGRMQVVAVEGCLSDAEEVISGVPQGTVLGPVLFLIHIGDIDSSLQHATASSFADDTRITMKIKCKEDCDRLQQDLELVYEWATENNMAFNEEKFEHIRYGSCENLSGYRGPDGASIEVCQKVKDLGVFMTDDGKFKEHIVDMARSAKQKAGWILRVFETREKFAMLTLFKSLVLPLLEYCCQLWSPRRVGLIRKIEAVQRSFTYRIRGMQDLNYWERLERLELYSLERRRDRYFIVYVWKIINNLAPNLSNEHMAIYTRNSERRGLMCRIPAVNTAAVARVQTLKEDSFIVHGPRLFNAIPRELREFSGTLYTFKVKLDRYLKSVPDKPALPHYVQSAAGNGLLEQLAQQRAQNR